MSITLIPGETKRLDISLIPIIPPEERGRIQGYVLDAITNQAIPQAQIYVDGKFDTTADKTGGFRTHYMDYGSHTLMIYAGGYETGVFEISLNESLLQDYFYLEPMEEVLGFPSDIDVTNIDVQATAILGQQVAIDVALYWTASERRYPHTVTGTIYINGEALTETIEMRFRNPTMSFSYTPTRTGLFTVKAKNQSAIFEVLPGAGGIFYSPFGCIRTEPHVVGSGYPVPPAADPPYWTTKADLVQHMVWTTFAQCEVPGCYVQRFKDGLVHGAFTAYSGNRTGYDCPHCGVRIMSGRHDYIGIMAKLVDHIGAVHPEFPLDKPPAGICTYHKRGDYYQWRTGLLCTPGQYTTALGAVTLPDWGSVARLYPDEGRVVIETWEERLP